MIIVWLISINFNKYKNFWKSISKIGIVKKCLLINVWYIRKKIILNGLKIGNILSYLLEDILLIFYFYFYR